MVDEQTLRRLADNGLELLPSELLAGLIAWCWDRADFTGDARYFGIARTLEPISRAFDEADEAGGVSITALRAVDEVLTRRLSTVLDEPDAEAASLLARSMRDDVLIAWTWSR